MTLKHFNLAESFFLKNSVGTRGQTFIEYTLLIGIVVAMLLAITPLMKRGTQSFVKFAADQVGNQKLADQKGGESGHLISADMLTRADKDTSVRDRAGEMTYSYALDQTETVSNQLSNLGYFDGQ